MASMRQKLTLTHLQEDDLRASSLRKGVASPRWDHTLMVSIIDGIDIADRSAASQDLSASRDFPQQDLGLGQDRLHRVVG